MTNASTPLLTELRRLQALLRDRDREITELRAELGVRSAGHCCTYHETGGNPAYSCGGDQATRSA